MVSKKPKLKNTKNASELSNYQKVVNHRKTNKYKYFFAISSIVNLAILYEGTLSIILGLETHEFVVMGLNHAIQESVIHSYFQNYTNFYLFFKAPTLKNITVIQWISPFISVFCMAMSFSKFYMKFEGITMTKLLMISLFLFFELFSRNLALSC